MSDAAVRSSALPQAGLRNTEASWGWPARVLHWGIAVLVVGMWLLGKYMTGLGDTDLAKYSLYQWHKSFGLTVFALALARLLWRLLNPTPAMPPTMPAWERLAAKVSHALFYLLLLAIPMSGFVMVAASPWGIPTVLFGVLPIPHPIGPDAALEGQLKSVHEALGNLLAVLLLVHVGAALKHALWSRDGILRRITTG